MTKNMTKQLFLPAPWGMLDVPSKCTATFEYEGRLVTSKISYAFSDTPWGSGYMYNFFDVEDIPDICIREDDVLAWAI